MSSSQRRLAAATDTRLAVIMSAAVNLKAQLLELNELRERVNKELPRKSPQQLPSAVSERTADQFR
jgi:hypothetical protein